MGKSLGSGSWDRRSEEMKAEKGNEREWERVARAAVRAPGRQETTTWCLGNRLLGWDFLPSEPK